MSRSSYIRPILNKLELSQQVVMKVQMQNFTKIHPVGAALFCEDGWMDGRTDEKTQQSLTQLHDCT
jgi:hypothetical protein